MKLLNFIIICSLISAHLSCADNNQSLDKMAEKLDGEKISTVFAHGLFSNNKQKLRFTQACPDSDDVLSFDFPENQSEQGYGLYRLIGYLASYWNKPLNLSNMYMGQNKDIDTIHEYIKNTISDDKPIVLFGLCKGGSTIINYTAQYNPENMKALVLDSSPANMPEILHDRFMDRYNIPQSWDKAIFRIIFPAYPENAIPPIQAIKNITNKDLPILIIHSQNDTDVSFLHALKLAQEFKTQEFNHVYLARIPYGKHAYLMEGDQETKDAYLQAVHTFYKQYKLSHNQIYALDSMEPYSIDQEQIRLEIAQSIIDKQFKN